MHREKGQVECFVCHTWVDDVRRRNSRNVALVAKIKVEVTITSVLKSETDISDCVFLVKQGVRDSVAKIRSLAQNQKESTRAFGSNWAVWHLGL